MRDDDDSFLFIFYLYSIVKNKFRNMQLKPELVNRSAIDIECIHFTMSR